MRVAWWVVLRLARGRRVLPWRATRSRGAAQRAELEPQHSLEGKLQQSKALSVKVMVANLTCSSRH